MLHIGVTSHKIRFRTCLEAVYSTRRSFRPSSNYFKRKNAIAIILGYIRWREAAAKNEERYKPSMDLLREMFEK